MPRNLGKRVEANTVDLATSATSGFLYIPKMAGQPTGTPDTQSGAVPIAVDTTNDKLWFYSGSSWSSASGGGTGSSDLFVGAIVARIDGLGGTSSPTPSSNWVICNGSSVSGGIYNGRSTPSLHQKFLRGTTGATGGTGGSDSHTHTLDATACQFYYSGQNFYFLEATNTSTEPNLPKYYHVEWWLKKS
tara:strand:+ start:1291 stop:1857 length:567 start_codon:yes stop_codon:yes gene_type:complete